MCHRWIHSYILNLKLKWLKLEFRVRKKQHYIDLAIGNYARTMWDEDTMTKRNSFTRETGEEGVAPVKIQLFRKQESCECIGNSFNFSEKRWRMLLSLQLVRTFSCGENNCKTIMKLHKQKRSNKALRWRQVKLSDAHRRTVFQSDQCCKCFSYSVKTLFTSFSRHLPPPPPKGSICTKVHLLIG